MRAHKIACLRLLVFADSEYMAENASSKKGQWWRTALVFIGLSGFAAMAGYIRETPQQQEKAREIDQQERSLCQKAKACEQYNKVRLECAAAGNLKACIRIKMVDNQSYVGLCSGYNEDMPPASADLFARAPNTIKCFLLNLW
jgi:hypothetical protein